MILGIGTDITEVARIRESITRYGDRFLNRLYTEGERVYASSRANSAECYAARFAAKEAGMKAIGTGWRRGVTWKDFEVVNELSGRPILVLAGVARKIAPGDPLVTKRPHRCLGVVGATVADHEQFEIAE